MGLKLRNAFFTTLSLLTRFPLGAKFEADYSRCDFWIPALSVLPAAAAIGGFFAGFLASGSPALGILSSLGLQYFLFNLFHLDGLVDTADALLPAATRERRLEILKDPRVGTYGFFSGFLLLAFRLASMGSLFEAGIRGSEGLLALSVGLCLAPAAGRTAAALVAARLEPARSEGLGALMQGFSLIRIACGAAAAFLPGILAATILGNPGLSLLGLAAALVAALGSAAWIISAYGKALGGFTGDSLGAAVEIGETATLILLASLFHLFEVFPL
jgi:adenosylcobinamide-GDP ribazoletransferase